VIFGTGRVLARPRVEDEAEDEVGTRAGAEEEAAAELFTPSSAGSFVKIEARRGGAGEAQSVQSAAGGKVGGATVPRSRSGSERGLRRGGFGMLREDVGGVKCPCISSAETRMSDEVAAEAEIDAVAEVWTAMMSAALVRGAFWPVSSWMRNG
jgi:hypothetical protein